MGKKKGLHSNTVCPKLDMCSPASACFFCIMKEQNAIKRRAAIAKYFKEMPSRNEQGQVLVMSGLWNIAMAEPNDPEFPKLGIMECMACLIKKGLKDRRWLLRDQNVYIPYYAAHIIGSYCMNVEEFAEMAVEAGVIQPLVELMRGRMTWVEQRVAVRALGHLATYQTTFIAVSVCKEIVELAMELSSRCLEIVYTQFLQCPPSKRLRYHCDLLTRGMGGTEMENRKAEEWASQLQCWSLHLLNCFAYRDKFVPFICKPGFLKKLPKMWGGLVNENSPAGVGLLRILCYHKVGKSFIADCGEIVDWLCNTARSSDDWQYMAIECLLLLLQDHDTRSKVIDKAIVALVDLAEMETLGDQKRVGEMITEVLLKQHKRANSHTHNSSKRASSITRQFLDELWSLRQRMKWEQRMSKEDLRVKRAAAMVVKLEGNTQFSTGDLKGAVSKYTEALALCPLKIRKERVVLYSNRAQCHLLLHDSDWAISDTTRALSISNPVNSHSKSLWRRAQAYDMKGLAKESLLDAIMFINECSILNGYTDKKYVKIPYYAAQMVRKQMHAAWLFIDAAQKHGNISVLNGDHNQSESSSSSSSFPSEAQEGEAESEWETVSEGSAGATALSPQNHQDYAKNANANGKSHQLELSSFASKAGGDNHRALNGRSDASTVAVAINNSTGQAQVNSGMATTMMLLPTIKEESISEEEKSEQKKQKWIRHEQAIMKNKNNECKAPSRTKFKAEYKHQS